MIREAFSDADPEGTPTYADNAEKLITELTEIDNSFVTGLSSCRLDHIIVSHEAYGHLAERYEIEQVGLAGLSPDSDATPQRLAKVIDEINHLGVAHVLQEPIVNNKLAQAVAAETDITILTLHPMESMTPAELDAGATYLSIMNENLQSLRTALDCK